MCLGFVGEENMGVMGRMGPMGENIFMDKMIEATNVAGDLHFSKELSVNKIRCNEKLKRT